MQYGSNRTKSEPLKIKLRCCQMNFEKEKRVVCSCSCVPFMEGVHPLS